MALISPSALRGGRLALLNPCPYPQLPLASRRSTKLNLRSKSITVLARYSQAQDFFTSRLQALAVMCKSLTDLDLKHCDKIDDSGFLALAYYSQNLRQINLSYCAVSEMALCMLMGNLTRLQDAKLVHLPNVTVDGLELALRACCARIKKVKLVASLSRLLSPEILEILHARGCKIRWD